MSLFLCYYLIIHHSSFIIQNYCVPLQTNLYHMKLRTIMMVFLTIACLAGCRSRKTVDLQVLTQAGMIEGIQDSIGSLKMYLGVPFAAAPVGDLRWCEPQPVETWEGVRETKQFGPDPMQKNVFGDMNFRGAGRSEDCLYLNIWTPAQFADEGLPVLIYFNGGGLVAGSGSEPRYDGAAIARRGVIGVTANYREGVFGFMAHPELSAETDYHGSGNYGFLDQVAAIRWVKDNIARFGGDPKRITIVGESAGSFSVSVLMCSPMSRDMIAGAMLSSGAYSPIRSALTLEQAETAGALKLEQAGIQTIAEARALSADELLQRVEGLNMSGLVIDHHFFYEDIAETFAKNEQAQVPLLAGWNSQEGHPMQYIGANMPNLENLKDGLHHRLGDMTDEICEAYGLLTDDDIFTQNANDLCGDLFTGYGTWHFCRMQADAGLPVYRYKFCQPRPQPSAKMQGLTAALAGGVREQTEEEKRMQQLFDRFTKGAVHSADIEYAMGNLATNIFYDWTDDDYAISDLFLSYYANFCKTGNPNGEGLPHWDMMTGAEVAPVMHIDVESQLSADAAVEHRYNLLVELYNK